MNKTRRTIRKLPPPAGSERLWPTQLAVLLLTAYLVGLEATYLSFEDARWYANAAFVIGLTIALAAALMLVMVELGRRMRRTLLFAATVSVLVHVLLVVTALQVVLFTDAWPELFEVAEVKRPAPPVTAPDYHSHRNRPDERQPQDFERPVPAELPQPDVMPLQQDTQQAESLPREPQPIAVPEPRATVQPDVVNRPIPSEAAPRHSAQPAELSRQQRQLEQPQTRQPVQVPQAIVESRDPSPPLAPQAAPVSRRAAEQVVEPQAVDEQVTVQMTPPAETPQRHQPEETPREATTAARPDRRALATAPPLQNAQPLDAAQRAEPSAESSADLQPRAAAISRRQAEQVVQPQAMEHQPTVQRTVQPTQPAATARRDQPEEAPRDVATTARPERQSLADAPPVPQAQPLDTSATAQAGGEPTQDLQPRSADVARNGGSATPLEQRALELPNRPPAAVRAASPQRRSQPASRPDVSATTAGRDGRPPVARAPQSLASAPVPVEQPSPQPNPEAGSPVLQAARTGLQRSSEGVAGESGNRNLDRSAPAGDRPALVASGSAVRERSTQREPEGPALAPAAPAVVSRSRAEAQLPSARLEAQPLENATQAGSRQAAPNDLAASAAVRLDRAAADDGEVTASQGSLDVDLGPTQVVPDRQVSRGASGGGQPNVTLQNDSGQVARGLQTGTLRRSPEAERASVAGLPAAGALETDEADQLAARRVAQQRASDVGIVTEQDEPLPDVEGRGSEPPTTAIAQRREAGQMQPEGASPAANVAGAVQRQPKLAERPAASSTASVPPAAAESAAAPAAQPQEDALAGKTQLARRAADLPARGPRAVTVESPAASFGQLGNIVRSPRSGDQQGPPVEALADSATAPRRAPSIRPPSSLTGEEGMHLPLVAVPERTDPAALSQLADAAEVQRSQLESLRSTISVAVEAAEGPGGTQKDGPGTPGIADRRARPDSMEMQTRVARLLRKQAAGVPDLSTTAVIAAEPFRHRDRQTPAAKQEQGGSQPGPETERAIELGLTFLARYQGPDGRWSLSGFGEDVALSSDTAATGLALLAFQGAGYNHRHYKYADVVRAGVDYLVKNQRSNGDLFVPLDDASNQSVWLYSHSIAALALCEAYGMTQDPELREPAQLALEFIIASQQERRGGWRYAPNDGSDTSVTGWMVMALKSGDLAGLQVPEETYDRVVHWLDLAQLSSNERHLYRYNPYAPDTATQRHGRLPSPAMTAVGLLMRLYTGWRRDNRHMILGADYLSDNLPQMTSSLDRDTYYWYYATQVMFHMGGEHWRRWNQRLHPLLVETQTQQGPLAGSWHPRYPVADRWAPHAGRLYVTTMNLLSLEIHYRHLPLYDETAR